MTDSTQRFSNRVDNYVKYRPSYPQELVAALHEACGLTPASKIADVGSGTGLLTELFLRNGNPVFAVEPNTEMRKAGERQLAQYPKLQSIAAAAEATTLPDHGVDFIVAGQAFHWFDRARAREEFRRILAPGGWVVLVWNERETASTPFMRAYETFLQRYSTDYSQVDHKQITDAVLNDFYGPEGFRLATFPNRQEFDFDGLRGRLLSSSYTPEAGHPDHKPMLAELARIFAAHAEDGRVAFEYTTRMYYNHLS
ncbi:MAG: class I SAM-dependent methyltransferase [Acidihalobacter sp.]|uniref:class I SAM-dependent methyltransferase n=1 Tax=Acidihalobacter sp. TaxID=1872108 RepID=UPI00307E67F7